jgi:kumamolisin
MTFAHPNYYFYASPDAASSALTAVQVAKAYRFPTGVDGTGQTIAIVELGGGYSQRDLDQYFAGLGLPTPHVVAVGVGGAANSPGDEADGEVLLDIQVAGGVAPGANQVIYFAPNTDSGFLSAITAAIDASPTPVAISISWGAPETQWTTSALKQFDAECARAKRKGILVLAAAGDNGANDGTRSKVADFPASSPNVLACGGTKLLINSDGSRTTESVWGESASSATGGGFSRYFTRPAYQAAALGGFRGVPDLSGNASPVTGYRVVIDGQWEVVGGTSAVAPLFAGLAALLVQATGQTVPNLSEIAYANPDLCIDVTSGSNLGYTASIGWDAASGVGVPVGVAFQTFLGTAAGPDPGPAPTDPPPVPTEPTRPDSADLVLMAALKQWLIARGITAL